MVHNPFSQQICFQERSLRESCSELNSLVSVAIFHPAEHFFLCSSCARRNWFENLACNLSFHFVQFGNFPNWTFLLRGRS